MRGTINIDDKLIENARSLTGTRETSALVRLALETLVRIEAGKRLIALGGTMSEAKGALRRRSAAGDPGDARGGRSLANRRMGRSQSPAAAAPG